MAADGTRGPAWTSSSPRRSGCCSGARGTTPSHICCSSTAMTALACCLPATTAAVAESDFPTRRRSWSAKRFEVPTAASGPKQHSRCPSDVVDGEPLVWLCESPRRSGSCGPRPARCSDELDLCDDGYWMTNLSSPPRSTRAVTWSRHPKHLPPLEHSRQRECQFVSCRADLAQFG
ncbi:unnamed protein product [Miscanthus lutarioriparius]|uniref:Uncharacterized protein n=1 Tax=Miscanthus lutarioriparius TaxID=422564 RepID=A0A811QCR7_9POAL|nr:unnamed protein product [Miscanthus lutarioriparius]